MVVVVIVVALFEGSIALLGAFITLLEAPIASHAVSIALLVVLVVLVAVHLLVVDLVLASLLQACLGWWVCKIERLSQDSSQYVVCSTRARQTDGKLTARSVAMLMLTSRRSATKREGALLGQAGVT